MKLLQISNDYLGSNVHSSLVNEITSSDGNITADVYVPLNYKNRQKAGNIEKFEQQNIKIKASTVLKPYHKYLYRAKINTLFKDIQKRYSELGEFNITAASTLCVDGAVAYEIYKKHEIPYTVTIRNTDVNTYFKIFRWQKKYFYEILQNAKMVFFVSKQYKKRFLKDVVATNVAKSIESKCMIIPNGIDPDFLSQRNTATSSDSPALKLVYVGGVNHNKNIHAVVQAIDKAIKLDDTQITYDVIGAYNNSRTDIKYLRRLEKLSEKRSWFRLLDSINKTELLESLRKYTALIMVSHHETFGLVYAEALSQGLPIIYTKGQGFDMFFPDGDVGYSAMSSSVDDIARCINLIQKNHSSLTKNIASKNLDMFSWSNIAKQYVAIYKQVQKP